ncbi:hypothetical protein Cpap_1448 [Ruminiclostridium papyrosolvens DSM 2782]|uniref:Uncharacterized protein n=1 Tax=Ruminiclostridium papyrosolvens DSM 2782 TaxID=588581 RepID=F1TE90_9FIRM|nr:hypothetical protein Cpap_1448 [Ruminiclostridium papyrosolvens DSM 2782]
MKNLKTKKALIPSKSITRIDNYVCVNTEYVCRDGFSWR